MPYSDYLQLLGDAHIKPTANRILVLEALWNASRPLSLQEIGDLLESLDKSSVSRVLSLFRASHLVHVIEDGSESVRYEACRSRCAGDRCSPEDGDQHAHFYCERCRLTFCMEGLAVPALAFPDGYQVHSVNLVAKGLCPECLQKEKGRIS